MKKLSFCKAVFSCLLLAGLFNNHGLAQSYTLSFPSNGYTANASPTNILSASTDDALSAATNIGFNFVFGCTTYTQFKASSNGWLTFNTSYTGNDFTNNLASGANKPMVGPLWDDLMTSASGNVNYQLTGSAPNRVLTVEWKQMQWTYSAAGDVISFQVKLYETTNVIDFVYKQGATAVTSGSASIGIAPSSTAGDYFSLNGTGATPTANYGSETSTLSAKPADGEVYRWTPGSMSYSSCTTTQASTANSEKCSSDQEIICMQVVVTGGCGSANTVSQFQVNMNGTTAAVTSQVSLLHIYYTGTTNTFSATNEFSAGGTASAAGTISINGSQSLSSGTNYFWLAYDIIPTAPGTTIDAECTQITVTGTGGGNKTPTTTAPAGTRSLVACSSYPGTSALGLKHWIKSDAGVSGTSVSTWADQSGAAITGNLTASGTVRPTVVTGAINFQDYIRFDGSNDVMVSTNSFTGNTLFSTTDNTILMIKNYKSGTVDYKWETDPTNAWRIGMEINGSAQRIDFVDDNGGGKNNLSTTAIINKDVMVEYLSSSTNINLKLNGNFDAVMTHPGLTFSPGVTSKPLYIGSNDIGNPLYTNVDLAEVLTFNKKLSASELVRVESYLSIKYGLTLGNNKGTGSSVAYYSSDGTQIWNNHTGYHNYVIGLGRDNTAGNSGLHKLKSTSVSSLNGSVDIITLANSDFTTPASFANDKAFILVGSNAGSLATPIVANYTHGGPSTAIVYQLSRVWATQKTGTHSGNMIIEFNTALINGPTGYGTNTNADLRLLVDNDAVFSNASAGEHTYSPNAGYSTTGGMIYFSVPYSDIQSGTGYFTLGSINGVSAPLPVELTDLNVKCSGNTNLISWNTVRETNTDHFEIERGNGVNEFVSIGNINAAINSLSVKHYEFKDQHQTLNPFSYYRIKSVDQSGNFSYFSPENYDFKNCNEEVNVDVFPNPFNSDLNIRFKEGEFTKLEILDSKGNSVSVKSISDETGLTINMEEYADGIYCIRLTSAAKSITKKVIKQSGK